MYRIILSLIDEWRISLTYNNYQLDPPITRNEIARLKNLSENVNEMNAKHK